MVLRDHFKFRKNLDCGQWLVVGRELEKRQGQGQQCLVWLSGVQLKPHLVAKNIRRARRELGRGKAKISRYKDTGGSYRIAVMVDFDPGKHDQIPDVVSITINTPERHGGQSERVASQGATFRSASRTSQLHTSDDATLIVDCVDNDLMRLVLDYRIEKAHAEIQVTVPSQQLIALLRRFCMFSMLYRVQFELLILWVSSCRGYFYPAWRHPHYHGSSRSLLHDGTQVSFICSAKFQPQPVLPKPPDFRHEQLYQYTSDSLFEIIQRLYS